MSSEEKPLDQGSIVSATSFEVDPPRERPARVRDIETLDEDLTAEIRRQTCYLILALSSIHAGQGVEDVLNLRTSYLADCDDADKRPPHK